jgi:hypothetical protein
MQRSSLRLLILAVALITAAFVYSIALQPQSAPPMTKKVVEDILERGKSALTHSDVDGIMSLFTHDARLFGRSPRQLRLTMDQAMRDLGGQSLSAKYSKLQVYPSGERAIASLELEVSQRLENADVSYFRPRLHLVLRKERVPAFLGLTTREEWRIDRLDAETPLELPLR